MAFDNFTEEMFRGKAHTFGFTVERVATAEGEDISGWDFRFTAKHSLADDDEDAVVALTSEPGGGIMVTDGPNGVGEVTIPAAATTSLPARKVRLWADLQGRPDGFDAETVARGVLVVRPAVTIAS